MATQEEFRMFLIRILDALDCDGLSYVRNDPISHY